jgi:hypothetical protein
LDGLEKKLREKYPKASDLSRRVKVNLVRYCDDIVRHEARTEHDARASAAGRRAASLSS